MMTKQNIDETEWVRSIRDVAATLIFSATEKCPFPQHTICLNVATNLLAIMIAETISEESYEKALNECTRIIREYLKSEKGKYEN